MERVEHAYQAGVEDARRDIELGKPKLRYGYPRPWGELIEEQLKSRFGVEMVWLSCFVTKESMSNDAGYNAPVEAFIDNQWGAGTIAKLHENIKKRRKEAYDAHFNNDQAT
jgi:hypothetical protein